MREAYLVTRKGLRADAFSRLVKAAGVCSPARYLLSPLSLADLRSGARYIDSGNLYEGSSQKEGSTRPLQIIRTAYTL